MTRIGKRFEALRKARKTGFVAYITAGDPDLATTRKLVPELERRGVDILELGVPFSDPLADGPEIQRASQRALRHRVSISDVLDLVADLRQETEIPIVLFTYFNPMHRYGLKRLVDRAAEAGVDGILALDLPPEEAADYKDLMSERGMDTIFLIAPTSGEERIRRIASHTSGFVYYVSRTGVTGERDSLEETLGDRVAAIRRHTSQPVAVGFGISTPEQSREVAGYADAVVVGSAIVRRIAERHGDPDLVSHIGAFVEELAQPLKGASDGS